MILYFGLGQQQDLYFAMSTACLKQIYFSPSSNKYYNIIMPNFIQTFTFIINVYDNSNTQFLVYHYNVRPCELLWAFLFYLCFINICGNSQRRIKPGQHNIMMYQTVECIVAIQTLSHSEQSSQQHRQQQQLTQYNFVCLCRLCSLFVRRCLSTVYCLICICAKTFCVVVLG